MTTPIVKLGYEDSIRSAYISFLQGNATEKEKKDLSTALENPKMLKMCQELEAIWKDPKKRELLLLNPTSPLLDKLTTDLLNKYPPQKSNYWFHVFLLCLVIFLVCGVLPWYLAMYGPK